jgi:predicted transcriptional regulator of viral defense system
VAGRSRTLDVLYELAEEHGGFFTSREALDAGVGHTMLSYHATHGDLERVAHGVYRLTRYPAHRFGDVIAAALWAGPDAAASHDTALAVYGLAEALPSAIHLTLPRRFRGQRPGVRVHEAPLPDAQVWQWEYVPVTRPERTVLDVARMTDPALAQQAAREALDTGLTTRRRLAAALADAPDRTHLRRLLKLRLPAAISPAAQAAG